MSIEISPTGKAVGAEIRGLDLSQPVSDADVEKVDQALNAYGVIFFRDQTLAPEQQLDLTWRFGALAPNTFGETHGLPDYPGIVVISNVVENGREIGVLRAARGWRDPCACGRKSRRVADA